MNTGKLFPELALLNSDSRWVIVETGTQEGGKGLPRTLLETTVSMLSNQRLPGTHPKKNQVGFIGLWQEGRTHTGRTRRHNEKLILGFWLLADLWRRLRCKVWLCFGTAADEQNELSAISWLGSSLGERGMEQSTSRLHTRMRMVISWWGSLGFPLCLVMTWG